MAGMRIVFMGSSGFACASLAWLLKAARDEVVLVVTQPDRPRGRNLEVTGCQVKVSLEGRGVPIFSPAHINEAASLERLAAARPDLIVVVAYGQFLKAPLLSLPPLGCLNVHGSLLPKYRGAAPVQWAMACGETVTGVTTMFVNERMDAGDMILKRELPIADGETGGELHDRLALAGAELLGETLDLLRQGKAPRTAQDESAATYAPKLTKADGRMDWSRPARQLCNRIRAFQPWPGCTCEIPKGSGMRVRILRADPDAAEGVPGTVLEAGARGILVQSGDGSAVRLLEVQPEGRKAMLCDAFLRGRRIVPGMMVQ